MSKVSVQQTVNERRTLNLWPETGRILGLGKNAVYAAAARGEIPTIRVGGRVLVLKDALDQLLSAPTRKTA